MYDEILFPYDGSDGAGDVLHHAGAVAHWSGGTVRLLYVADTNQHSVTRVEGSVVDGMVGHGEDVLVDATAVLDSLSVEYATDVVQGTPAETIVEYAEEYGQDVVVMPTQGRSGLSRYLLGSVTEKVVRLSDRPVLTARMTEDEKLDFPYEGLLIPTDGSLAAEHAVGHGLELAAALDATVHALSVAETTTVRSSGAETTVAEDESGAIDAVERVASAADNRGLDCQTHVETGSPAEVVVDAVETGPVDAVVMGTTGRRGIERILLGSVAEKTVRSAPVPVVTVAEPDSGGTPL